MQKVEKKSTVRGLCNEFSQFVEKKIENEKKIEKMYFYKSVCDVIWEIEQGKSQFFCGALENCPNFLISNGDLWTANEIWAEIWNFSKKARSRQMISICATSWFSNLRKVNCCLYK